jgi:hypothetical protein
LVGFVAAGEEREARERVTGTKVAENIVFPFFPSHFHSGKEKQRTWEEKEKDAGVWLLVFQGVCCKLFGVVACLQRKATRYV